MRTRHGHDAAGVADSSVLTGPCYPRADTVAG